MGLSMSLLWSKLAWVVVWPLILQQLAIGIAVILLLAHTAGANRFL